MRHQSLGGSGKQAGKMIVLAMLDQDGATLGEQAMHFVVAAQEFTFCATVENLDALALAPLIGKMNDLRRQDGRAVLVDEHARIIQFVRRALQALEKTNAVSVFGFG